MNDPVLLLALSIVAGSLSGFAAAAIFIKSHHQYLDEKALEFRKAARRLENANKLESIRMSLEQGNFR